MESVSASAAAAGGRGGRRFIGIKAKREGRPNAVLFGRFERLRLLFASGAAGKQRGPSETPFSRCRRPILAIEAGFRRFRENSELLANDVNGKAEDGVFSLQGAFSSECQVGGGQKKSELNGLIESRILTTYTIFPVAKRGTPRRQPFPSLV